MLKDRGKNKPKRAHSATRLPETSLTAHEMEQLCRPEIPLEEWRKGQSLFGAKIAITQTSA